MNYFFDSIYKHVKYFQKTSIFINKHLNIKIRNEVVRYHCRKNEHAKMD